MNFRSKAFILISISAFLNTHILQAQSQFQDRYMLGNYYLIRDNSDEKLIKVRLIGEFSKPGVYMVSKKSKLVDVLAYAGGLTNNSNGEISMARGKLAKWSHEYSVDDVLNKKINEGDLLYAKKSWKANASVYLQILTTVLSLATFAVVVSNQK